MIGVVLVEFVFVVCFSPVPCDRGLPVSYALVRVNEEVDVVQHGDVFLVEIQTRTGADKQQAWVEESGNKKSGHQQQRNSEKRET